MGRYVQQVVSCGNWAFLKTVDIDQHEKRLVEDADDMDGGEWAEIMGKPRRLYDPYDTDRLWTPVYHEMHRWF